MNDCKECLTDRPTDKELSYVWMNIQRSTDRIDECDTQLIESEGKSQFNYCGKCHVVLGHLVSIYMASGTPSSSDMDTVHNCIIVFLYCFLTRSLSNLI